MVEAASSGEMVGEEVMGDQADMQKGEWGTGEQRPRQELRKAEPSPRRATRRATSSTGETEDSDETYKLQT